MRLREYKSTLIEKGLNCFISVKLLILETIVSQRPWLDLQACRNSKVTQPESGQANYFYLTYYILHNPSVEFLDVKR